MFRALQSVSYSKIVLGITLILAPWLLLILIHTISGYSILESVPVWSDELSYWHEILSLSQKGLRHGYYSYNEITPVLSSFGSHGFGTVTSYAIFANLFGWKTYSIVIANAFFMSLAFLLLCVMLKPTTKVLIILLLFTLSYTPYLLFSFTSMSEGLNYALLIVYFVFLYAYHQQEKKNLIYLLLAFCTLISFVRIVYILLFLPLIIIYLKEKKQLRITLLIIPIWIIFSIILFFTNSLFVSPYPDSFLNELFNTTGFAARISLFLIHFADNIINYINPISDNIFQVFERYFILIVLIYCFLKSGLLFSKSRAIEIRYFIVFLILILVLLITLGAYDVFDWRDYRVLSPVLYSCLLYLILKTNNIEFKSLLIINILSLFLLLLSPQTWHLFNEGRYYKSVPRYALTQIEYTRSDNYFDNTLAIKLINQQTIFRVPAGIGISTVDDLTDKLKSKYIFSETKLKLKTYKLIDSDSYGYLYSKK